MARLPLDRWVCVNCGFISPTQYLTEEDDCQCPCDVYEERWYRVVDLIALADWAMDNHKKDAEAILKGNQQAWIAAQFDEARKAKLEGN